MMRPTDSTGTATTNDTQLGERVRAIPTIGFNVEELTYRNLDLTVWDVGGQSKIRALWRHYYPGTDALIYVVDSADIDRLNIAGMELHQLMKEDALGNVPVLVFANKQDLPHAANVQEVAEGLGLQKHDAGARRQPTFPWYVQSCSAVLNDGLVEGLDWLAREIVAVRQDAEK
jgi:ADP-ribosylation factor 1/2